MTRWLLKICCFLLFYFGKFHRQDKWVVPRRSLRENNNVDKTQTTGLVPYPRDVLFNLTEPNMTFQSLRQHKRFLLRQIFPAVCSA